MKRPGKRVLGAAGAVVGAVVLAGLAVRTWVVPALIVSKIEGVVGGRVEIGGWWLNGRSAGVTRLRVHEGPGLGSPVWASAARATTDLSLGGLLRGRFAPGRVRIERPEVSVRFDRSGALVTRIGPATGGGTGAQAGPLPVVTADEAVLTLQQEGRPAMVVHGVTARLGPAPGGKEVVLSARSNDPEWGPFEAHGVIDGGFQTGQVELKTMRGVTATPEKVKAIPFVPAEVWSNVAPNGEVGATLRVSLDRGTPHVHTEVRLLGTAARSEALGLTATGATGRVIVDDTLVTFDNVSGRAIDGRVTGHGTADFGKSPPAFDLSLSLDGINVGDTPKSWQLDEAGVTGLLSGKVRLKALLRPDGVDLSGTTGRAVVEKATLQGIPVKALELEVSASGGDLRYGAPKAGAAEPTSARDGLGAALAALAVAALPVPDPPAPAGEAPKAGAGRPSIHLPQSVTTHIELEDVELSDLIARAQLLLGYPFPVPITGKLSVKAVATIPLGKLKEVKGYAFHGDLTLARASAYKVDLGRVSARVDLADGVLELRDFRGRLVDHPDGGPDNPPESGGAPVPATGPLPPGAFRGTLTAAIAPPGKLTARFEGAQLPLGELGAPFLPRPTPLSGLATMNVRAEADLTAAADPAAWSVSGTAESRQIHYRGAALDGVSVAFGLKNGRLDVSELTASLRDRPLRARMGLDLKPPRAFQGVVDVAGWDLAAVLAWVPGAPTPAPVAGTLSARAEAEGALEPFSIKTEGRGSFERLQAGPVTLGAVPFQWTTRDDTVALSVTDARPFGGRVSAEANIPLTPGKPIDGSATVDSIDTAALSAAAPGAGLAMTGRASGRVTFAVPADASALEANVRLSAPDLTVQGVPAEHVKATLKAHRGALRYEISAESLGGVIRFDGEVPLSRAQVPREAEGEFRAVGFTLDRVWKALGLSGAVAEVGGRGAVDANVRLLTGGPGAGLYAHGLGELRDVKFGTSAPMGRFKGILVWTPESWRVDPIGGEFLGGLAGGSLWGSETAAEPGRTAPARQVGFDLRLDRVALRDAAALLPAGMPHVQGYASLRMAGALGEGLHANGEVNVPSARVGGLAVSGLRVPVVVSTTGGLGSGVVHVRRYVGRVAGGRAHGDAWFHVGADRAFKGDLNLSDVDLESIARIESDAKSPASGKVSGRITLSGHDPLQPKTYRGRVSLELSDASLVAMPVFRELDKFLGSARGGLFEAGDLNGVVANRQLVIDAATLQGRLAQVHATGTVGFDSQLNLEVLVNTNPVVSEAGASLASALPGLRGAVGRNREVTAQATSYLSSKLLKLRVTGTLRNPSVSLDPSIGVGRSAAGFFTGVLGLVR